MVGSASDASLFLSPLAPLANTNPPLGLNSPDTQRTLSPGTVTSLSPNGGLNCGGHQHAEPRFIFNPVRQNVVAH